MSPSAYLYFTFVDYVEVITVITCKENASVYREVKRRTALHASSVLMTAISIANNSELHCCWKYQFSVSVVSQVNICQQRHYFYG